MTSNPHWFKSRVRDLDRAECLTLLHSQRVGRLAFTDDSGTDVIPVNFVLDGGDLLIATSAYGPIARSATGARVAFEVDGVDDFTESGWSVVVRGRTTREAPFDLPAERPYPWAEGTRSYVLRVHAEVVTGRRLIPS